MRDLDLERRHNQAIRQEIGERLPAMLSRDAVDVPPRLRELVGRLDDDRDVGKEASNSKPKRNSIVDWVYRR